MGCDQVVGRVTAYISEGSDPVFLPWYSVWVSGETLTLPGSGKPVYGMFDLCRPESGGV